MSSYPGSGTFMLARARQRPRRERLADADRDARRCPTGTSITYQTRTGATPPPDASWSAWQPLGTGGAIASPAARYIQYRATHDDDDARLTPDRSQRVQISYGAGTDRAPVPGTVTLSPPRRGRTRRSPPPPSGFSDPDGDPLTYHYQWFRNGTLIAGATATSLNLGCPATATRATRSGSRPTRPTAAAPRATRRPPS